MLATAAMWVLGTAFARLLMRADSDSASPSGAEPQETSRERLTQMDFFNPPATQARGHQRHAQLLRPFVELVQHALPIAFFVIAVDLANCSKLGRWPNRRCPPCKRRCWAPSRW